MNGPGYRPILLLPPAAKLGKRVRQKWINCKRDVLPGFCAHHFVRWTGAFEKGEWVTWVVPGPSTIRPSTANFGRRASRSVGATHRRWPDTAGDAGERGQSPGSAVLWLELLSSMW